MSEINLSLQDFRNGDPSSFNLIYQLFNQPILVFASSLVTDQHEAQDITIDSFVKLWRICDRFYSLASIRAFLYVTTRNACLDYWRREKRRQEMENQLRYLLEEDNSIKELEISSQNLPLLYEKLDSLPDQTREIMKMFLEGKSPAEIAKELDISRQHVYTQKSYAITRLKDILRHL